MNNPVHSKSQRPLLITIAAAVLLGAVFSMKMMATGLVFVAIFLIFWLPYSLYVILRKPERRRIQVNKIGIWFLMIAIVITIHYVRKLHTREYADSVIQRVETFHQKQGRYPDNLEEAGIASDELNAHLPVSHYSNKPVFYYPDTAMIFHMWSYDFRNRVWVSGGD